MKSFISLFVISLFTLILSGCKAGSGEGLNEQGRPIEETPQSSGKNIKPGNNLIEPTLISIQEHVFTPICSACHGGVSPAAGQDLSSIEKSIKNLINVDSSNPLFKRVLPGDPALSYLYLKISGNNQAGSRMPLGQPALSEEMIKAIKEWIAQGALVPESANVVAQVSKVARTTNNSDTEQITLWFNKAMDFSGLTREQVVIRATNQTMLRVENSWLLSNQQASLKIINDHVLQINLFLGDDSISKTNIFKAHALKADVLKADVLKVSIQLNNNSISTLTSASGQQLDGDFDGLDGGEFNYDVSF